MTGRGWFLVTFLMLGCGAEKPVPDKPTWAEDVLPILQANCFHCHGAPALQIRAKNPKIDIHRWDILDLSDPNYATLGFGEVIDPPGDPKGAKVFQSASDNLHFAAGIIAYATAEDEAGRMPPAPATRLADRDIQVLKNWMGNNYAPGKHSPNHKPVATWVTKNKTLAITDDDGDQVLGKLDCGGTEVSLDRSGLHTLPSDVSGPCSAMLYDGWGEITSVDVK